jgi:hypothetical protein
VTARTVFEQALTALRSVRLPEDVASSTRDAADELERAWRRSPWTAGLEGNLVARSELVNLLAGERVLDPFRRALGSAPLRLRRGSAIRYRVLRGDGSVEDRPAPVPEPREGDRELAQRAHAARGELASQTAALVDIERALPAVVRGRPAVWAVWRWPMRWLLAFVHRKALASWRTTQHAIGEARRKLADIERVFTLREQRERAAREAYYRELQELCGGGPAGQHVREIELSVPGLPDQVELVELMGELRASAELDAMIVVERDALYAPTPDGQKVKLGGAAETIPELPAVLARARALTLVRRARDKLGAARATIDGELDRAEAEFRERLRKLGKLALPLDTRRFAGEQLARMAPLISASITAILEHASTHLGSEIAQLGAAWIGAVARAATSDELDAAVGKIEEEWPVSARRIAAEVRVLVTGGAGGVARDLYVETVSVLRAHGLPEEHLRAPKLAPAVAPVNVLPSLTNPSPFSLGGNWFAGLFKSFDARRADLREKVHARVEHIRDVAAAEILDAEPELHAAVARALAAQLDVAIEHQQRWHQQALADEHAAIARDREALAPLSAARDAIASAAAQLDRATAQLEAERPAVAAAAIAAAS